VWTINPIIYKVLLKHNAHTKFIFNGVNLVILNIKSQVQKVIRTWFMLTPIDNRLKRIEKGDKGPMDFPL